MGKTEYIYARVVLSADVASHLLDMGDVIGRKDEDGRVEFILKQYTDNRADAQKIIDAARVVSREFGHVADNLEQFLDEFKFHEDTEA